MAHVGPHSPARRDCGRAQQMHSYPHPHPRPHTPPRCTPSNILTHLSTPSHPPRCAALPRPAAVPRVPAGAGRVPGSGVAVGVHRSGGVLPGACCALRLAVLRCALKCSLIIWSQLRGTQFMSSALYHGGVAAGRVQGRACCFGSATLHWQSPPPSSPSAPNWQ